MNDYIKLIIGLGCNILVGLALVLFMNSYNGKVLDKVEKESNSIMDRVSTNESTLTTKLEELGNTSKNIEDNVKTVKSNQKSNFSKLTDSLTGIKEQNESLLAAINTYGSKLEPKAKEATLDTIIDMLEEIKTSSVIPSEEDVETIKTQVQAIFDAVIPPAPVN